MYSRRCSKENCQNKIFAKCDCELGVLLCQEHITEHVLKPSINRHQLMQEQFRIADEIKEPIIEKLIELRKQIQIFRKEAITNLNEIFKSLKDVFGRYLDHINEVDKCCSKMIESLPNEEEFLDYPTVNDMEFVLKLDLQKANSRMARWNTNLCELNYDPIKEAISRIYEIPFNPFKVAIEDEVESNELSFFRDDSSDFSTINLDSFLVSTTRLQIPESINYCTSNCILPDKTYFYCCNPNTKSGRAFTIDKYKNVKQLQKSKVNSNLDPVCYNNFIYLIGGDNKIAERYDLKQNLWQKIASVPQDLDFSYSCNALFGESILITALKLEKLICYSITQDSYRDASNSFLGNKCRKFMLRANDRIYLFERSGRAFESSENDISKWTQIGTNNISSCYSRHQSTVVCYKGSLYFVECKNELWKFDLSSKKLSKVTTV